MPAHVNWRDAPADWRHDGIAMWLLPHAPRQRGEPQARESLAHTLGFAPETLPITRDAQGRPHFIAPLHHLETGWSHSGEALLLALGEDIELGVDIDQLAGFAVAGPEMAVVEHQAGVPGVAKPFREGVEPHLLDGPQAVRHHNHRARSIRAGQIQPATAGQTAGIETDVQTGSGNWHVRGTFL